MPVVSNPSFRVFSVSLLSLLQFVTCATPLLAEDRPEAEIYMADVHESAWNFKGSGALCELTHEIPQFGVARFQRLAGDELGFWLDSYQPVPERIEGVLREVSPPWIHNAADSMEQLIVVEAGLRPVSLDRRPAGWLLSALAKGQVGSFEMLDWNDSRKQRLIRLSPVNFQPPYRAFKQCLRELSQTGVRVLNGSGEGGMVKTPSVHFALDSDRLDRDAETILRDVVDLIKADPRISVVRLAGHADDQGEAPYNLRLSARRAERVFDFLTRRGVDPKRLSRRHFGESRPKVKGFSETARAANRRVEIELER